MINIIYGLRDPRNDVYQYIGKSTVGSKRALEHLTKSHSDKVNEWIKSLEDIWEYPLVDIIEEVNDLNELSNREKYWIEYYYNINPNLLNKLLIPKQINNVLSEDDGKNFDDLIRLITELPIILKRQRLVRNLSQEELAKEMNVNRGTIVQIENGRSVNFKNIYNYILVLKGIDIKIKSYNERVKQNR